MNYFGKALFSAATFSRNKHCHVCGRGLHGHLNGMVEQRTVSNDPKPLLDTLDFLRCDHFFDDFSKENLANLLA
jgi:hypothetical protein